MTAFDPEFYQIGPGFWGFLATFVMAVGVIVIYRSLTKHLRKVRRDEERAREERERKDSSTKDGESDGGVVAEEPGDGE